MTQRGFSSLAHVRIGLHREDFRAFIEQEAGEDACAGADVGHLGSSLQPAAVSQQGQYAFRIARAIPDIVRHPVGEA